MGFIPRKAKQKKIHFVFHSLYYIILLKKSISAYYLSGLTKLATLPCLTKTQNKLKPDCLSPGYPNQAISSKTFQPTTLEYSLHSGSCYITHQPSSMLSRIREKSAKNPLLEPRKKIDRRVVENSNSAKHQKSRFLSSLSRVHVEDIL